jgi:putative zinc finger/helix-turn-helix YgiT family protein
MFMLPENPKAKQAPLKADPFPWRCRHCGRVEVAPVRVDYPMEVNYDGRRVSFVASGIEIPVCRNCGEKLITGDVNRQINQAMHTHLRLLTPSEIRAGIEKLGLSQKEVAERLGIAEATLSRWLNDLVIQSRAMDNLLRVFLQVPEARTVLSLPAIESSLNIVTTPNAMS